MLSADQLPSVPRTDGGAEFPPGKLRACATRAWVANNEWPPRSKKLSWTPTRSMSSSSGPDLRQHFFDRACGARRTPDPGRVVSARAPVVPGGRSCRWTSGARHRAARRPPAPYSRAVCSLRKRRKLGRRKRRRAAPHRPPAASVCRCASSRARTTGSRTRRVLAKRGLDLAELDAKAADLDLVVGAAEELDGPVGPIAGQIAGPVEPCSGLGAEGIGNELLGGQLGPVEIAPRNTDAADMHLARHPDRHRMPKAVVKI